MASVKPAPLNASFMLTAILGFLISVVYVRKIDITWAFAFSIVFLVMIIASLISMIEAPVRGQLMPKFEREITDRRPIIIEGAAEAKPRKRKPKPKRKKAKKKGKRK